MSNDPVPVSEPMKAFLERMAAEAASRPAPMCDRCGEGLTQKEWDACGDFYRDVDDCDHRRGELCDGCFADGGRKARLADIGYLLRLAGVPPRYRECSRESWRGSWPPSLDAEHLPDVIYLWGAPGTGKTHMATAVLRGLLIDGNPCKWRDSQALVASLQDNLDAAGEIIDELSRIPFLVLDDLGNERQTDYARDRITLLVRNRYNDCKTTLVTANVPPEELASWDGRLISRLSAGSVLKLAGSDKRVEGP